MKVGVDGVLVGCWTDVEGCRRILDVGTGCGLIALIVAQRAPEAIIEAIDIDGPSIAEAKENIDDSPWKDRVKAIECPYSEVVRMFKTEERSFDLIISNPPYFNSGIAETVTPREKARHQGELSPTSLLDGASVLLIPEGSIAMIVPTEISGNLEELAGELGFFLERKCLIRGHKDAPYKRVLLQWRKSGDGMKRLDCVSEYLTLEHSSGQPTPEYRALCKDFYLRF